MSETADPPHPTAPAASSAPAVRTSLDLDSTNPNSGPTPIASPNPSLANPAEHTPSAPAPAQSPPAHSSSTPMSTALTSPSREHSSHSRPKRTSLSSRSPPMPQMRLTPPRPTLPVSVLHTHAFGPLLSPASTARLNKGSYFALPSPHSPVATRPGEPSSAGATSTRTGGVSPTSTAATRRESPLAATGATAGSGRPKSNARRRSPPAPPAPSATSPAPRAAPLPADTLSLPPHLSRSSSSSDSASTSASFQHSPHSPHSSGSASSISSNIPAPPTSPLPPHPPQFVFPPSTRARPLTEVVRFGKLANSYESVWGPVPPPRPEDLEREAIEWKAREERRARRAERARRRREMEQGERAGKGRIEEVGQESVMKEMENEVAVDGHAGPGPPGNDGMTSSHKRLSMTSHRARRIIPQYSILPAKLALSAHLSRPSPVPTTLYR